VKSGERFEATDLPWFFTLSWGWLIVASVIDQVLHKLIHWQPLLCVSIPEIWSFVQAGWLIKVDRRSQAIYWFAAEFILGLLYTFVPLLHRAHVGLIIFVILGASVLIAGRFVFRRDMLRYFNEVDETGLTLSPWMTLFFGMIYFQYHFNEIAEFKIKQSLNLSLSQSK
jgi:hypothetical protein